MSNSKKKRLEQLEKEIQICKNNINENEGVIISQSSLFQSPKKDISSSLADRNTSNSNFNAITPDNSSKRNEIINNDKQLSQYIKNMKKLQNNYQEKMQLLVQQNQHQKSNVEMEIKKLNQKIVEKDKKINEVQEELKYYRKQYVQIKQENKNMKADNKILMNQIDRLQQKQLTSTEKQQMFRERQMRVMNSLYKNKLINDKLLQQSNKNEGKDNKKQIEQVNDLNIDLKRVIRSLNEQNSILKQEKELLSEQNQQKSINLQNQQEITRISQQSNSKLNEIINKMGEKIISLQNINQTLKNQIERNGQDPSFQNQHYYQNVRSKVGQFYYKR